MRKGVLGTIAAVAAGAGGALGQTPTPAGPPAPAAVGEVLPVNGPGGGTPFGLGSANPPPVLMPPFAPGPDGDPQGLGPAAGFGQPPGPMYPPPGPYGRPLYQPGPADADAYGGVPRIWTTFEYLLWFNRDQPTRFPYLTTSAPTSNGLLGRPSTLILAGGGDISYGAQSGFRITSGFYGDASRRYGFEASGFLIPENSNRSEVNSSPSGIPTLARPFIDSAGLRASSSLVIANPNFAQGRAVTDISSSTWGVEASGVVNLFRSEPGCATAWSIDALAGYRFFELDEAVRLQSISALNNPGNLTPIFATGPFGIITQVGVQFTPVPVPFGGLTVSTPAQVTVTDDFRVTNRFNGGNFGLRANVRHGLFTVDATGKIGVGNMEQRVDIRGESSFVDGSRGTSGAAFGGLYANAANIGRYNRDEFAIIPEGSINVGVAVTRSLTAFVGYSYLYVSEVIRPGQLINPVVNSATVPFSGNYGAVNRPNAPGIVVESDDYWIQGVNFGFTLRY